MHEVDRPPEARTWNSGKYLVVVDDPSEARTWTIVFITDFTSRCKFGYLVWPSDFANVGIDSVKLNLGKWVGESQRNYARYCSE